MVIKQWLALLHCNFKGLLLAKIQTKWWNLEWKFKDFCEIGWNDACTHAGWQKFMGWPR